MNELLEQILSDIHEKAVMFTSGDVEFVREALSVKDVEAIIKRYMVAEDGKEVTDYQISTLEEREKFFKEGKPIYERT